MEVEELLKNELVSINRLYSGINKFRRTHSYRPALSGLAIGVPQNLVLTHEAEDLSINLKKALMDTVLNAMIEFCENQIKDFEGAIKTVEQLNMGQANVKETK